MAGERPPRSKVSPCASESLRTCDFRRPIAGRRSGAGIARSAAMDSQTEDNASAWEQAATQYGVDIKSDLNALRSRKLSLHPIEREMLGNLTACTRAIHLQCSHGQDTLSLWLLGAQEVVGLDISETMLEHASTK